MKQLRMIFSVPALLSFLTLIFIVVNSNSTLFKPVGNNPHIAILKSDDTGWTSFDARNGVASDHIPNVDRMVRESVVDV